MRHPAQHLGHDPPKRGEPTVIEYLKTPPPRERLKELISAIGIFVRALLREKGTPYEELGLDDRNWTDEQLIDQMLAHPILINRPIVVMPKGVKPCRPSEAVLDLLPNPHIGRFVKEDGEHSRPRAGWDPSRRRLSRAPQDDLRAPIDESGP